VAGVAAGDSRPWVVGAGGLAALGAAGLIISHTTTDRWRPDAWVSERVPGSEAAQAPATPVPPQPEPAAGLLAAPEATADPPAQDDAPVADPPIEDDGVSAGPGLEERLLQASATTDTDSAFAALMGLWSMDYTPGAARPCDTATEAGMRCLFQRGSWGQLLTLDRPAILSLVASDGSRHQVVLSGTTAAGDAILLIGGAASRASLAELMSLWMGEYLLIWRPGSGDGRTLTPGTTGGDVTWLRDGLSAVLDRPLVSPRPELYDATLASAVRRFQQDRRLQPDGVAGSRTLIALNTALALPDRPRLQTGS
jgi:general secretion pathway protein A